MLTGNDGDTSISGKVSMAFAGWFCVPWSDSLADREASERCHEFTVRNSRYLQIYVNLIYAEIHLIISWNWRANLTEALRLKLQYGWFSHPIYIGDYPPSMRVAINKNSQLEGRNTSRLPYFTAEEIREIKGIK